MNKRIFCIIVGLIICFNGFVFAQVSVQPGIAVGLSSYTQKIKTTGITIEPDSKMGFVAGVVLDLSVINIVSIEPGIFYSMRGMKMENSEEGITQTATENISYLAIPVHLKLKYPSLLLKPYGLAGLNLGILLSAKGKTEETGIPAVEEDIADECNPTDFGFDFGAGVEFTLPALTPFVEFAYYLGLTNVPKDMPDDVSMKNSGWELKGGLRFKL